MPEVISIVLMDRSICLHQGELIPWPGVRNGLIRKPFPQPTHLVTKEGFMLETGLRSKVHAQIWVWASPESGEVLSWRMAWLVLEIRARGHVHSWIFPKCSDALWYGLDSNRAADYTCADAQMPRWSMHKSEWQRKVSQCNAVFCRLCMKSPEVWG